MKSQAARIILAFATLYVIWGSTYLAIRIAVETLPPFLLAGTRFVLAGSLVLGWCMLRRRAMPTRREWIGAAGVGTFLVTLSNAPIVWVEQEIASGVVAVFAAGTPLLMALFSSRRTGTPIAPRTAFGLALGTFGLILLGSSTFDVSGRVLHMVALGGAMLAWAYGSTWGRDWPAAADNMVASGAQMLAGGVIATVVGLLLGEWNRFDPAGVTAQSVLAWAYLVVFGSVIAYTAYQWLLAHVDATAVSSYTYVNPVIALALGALFANEVITPRILLATALLIPAVVLVVTGKKSAVKGVTR